MVRGMRRTMAMALVGAMGCGGTPERNDPDYPTMSLEESVQAECEQAEACAADHGYGFDMEGCVEQGVALFEEAEVSGCYEAYEEAFRCTSDEAVCIDGVWVAEVACDSLLEAYAACGG